MRKIYRNHIHDGTGKGDDGWWETLLQDEEKYSETSSGRFEKLFEPREVVEAVNETTEKQVKPETDWKKITDLRISEEVISGVVLGYNRGGLLVDGDFFHGFVPVSHLNDVPEDFNELEIEPCLSPYIGRTINLKVIECEKERGRIVLSERAAKNKPGERTKILRSIMEGDEVSGVVTNITDFGVFIDLGGIEGLVHISELSWGRVHHPSDIMQMKEEVVVQVLQVDSVKGRVALSLKQLIPNPWDEAVEKFTPGDLVEATVTDVVKYGVFARLDDGLEGLIHVSEMGSTGHISPSDICCKGQQIKARILQIIPEKQRMSMKLVTSQVPETEYYD